MANFSSFSLGIGGSVVGGDNTNRSLEGTQRHKIPFNLGNNGNGSGSNMRRLLEDLHMSRLSVQNDRNSYEKARHELEAYNQKIQTGSQVNSKTDSKIVETEELCAVQSTELSHLEIKDKVVSEDLDKVTDEVKTAWDELKMIRTQEMEVTNRYLRESCNFSQFWNCTELGRKNRQAARAKDIEELRRQKHRMEYDLEELLRKMAQVKDVEQERIDLENRFKSQEQSAKNRENEAYSRLQDVQDVLSQLRKKDESFVKEFEGEVNRIQARIEKSRESISYLERRVSETQRALEKQRSQSLIQNQSTGSAVANLNVNQFRKQQDNNQGFNTNQINHKSARIYQPVRSIPEFSNRKAGMVGNRNNSSNVSQAVYQKQSDSFTGPPHQSKYGSVNTTALAKNSRPSIENHVSSSCKENQIQNAQSSYFTSDNQSSLSSSLLPNANCPKPVPSGTGRVFQFKKKSSNSGHEMSMDNNAGTISGPTNRSVTVTLGSTPFATFQNGKQILQQQKYSQHFQNNNDSFAH